MVITIKRRSQPIPAEPLVDDTAPNLDAMCSAIVVRSKNAAVSWWLMGRYTRDCLGTTLLSELKLRELARVINDEYAGLDHPHKHLLDVETGTLRTGTTYPLTTQFSAKRLLKDQLGGAISVD